VRELALAIRYAEALFLAARERNALDAVAQDVASVQELLRDRKLLAFLESPQILDEDKEAVVRRVFRERVHPLVVDLLLLLLDKHRISHLPDILEMFQRRLDEYRGILKARVVTAVPLPDEEAERLRRNLEARTGKKVVLEREVDPSILGGVTVILGNRIIDGSLRNGLEKVRQYLLEATVHEPAGA
jgi:ATP synthase F1 delta subunit